MSNLELTKEQEKEVDDYVTVMLKNGLRTNSEINDAFVKESVHFLYRKFLDIQHEVTIHYVDSPEQAINMVHESTKIDKKELIKEIIFLNLWTWWVAFYWAGINILKETKGIEKILIEDLDRFEKICRHFTAILPCEKICFVIQSPVLCEIKNNDLELFQLHNPNDFSIKYKDGTGYGFIDGISVPDYIIKTPSEKLDVKKVLSETNIDVRRVGLEKIGAERMMKELKSKLLDSFKSSKKWEDYELYELEIEKDKHAKVLKMYNPSTGGYHYEGVGDHCKTIEEAKVFRFPFKNITYKEPEIIT